MSNPAIRRSGDELPEPATLVFDATEAPTLALPAPTSPINKTTNGTPMYIGDYRIIRKLGEGGMGVVYEAEQQHPRRPVALKVIRGGQFVGALHVQLFQREVQALALLKHPGIAAIYDAGQTEDGQHYFAMELAPGVPLMEYIKQRQPEAGELRQRLELFLKLADAISYAHQRGVIHRDLKPANILASDGSAGQTINSTLVSRGEIKVLDFGLARITEAEEAGSSQLSAVGQIKGTLAYMSPEQVRGNPDEIDVRTDVYALGMVLYELLTERLPYDVERATLPEALRIICEEPPKSLSQTQSFFTTKGQRDKGSKNLKPAKVFVPLSLRPFVINPLLKLFSFAVATRTERKSERIDRDVETIVLKALEKDPNRRYQSVAAMAEDITRYLTNQPISARPPSAVYQFRKLVARHKALFAFLGSLFVLSLGFGVTMAVQSARIARERDKAVSAEQMAATQRDAAEQARGAEQQQRLAAEQAQGAAELAQKAEAEQRLAAETNLSLANEQRTRAEQGELASRQLLYASQMKLAQVAWDENRLEQMTELLESQRPQPGQADQRGFEWHYLWRLSNREVLRFKGHALPVFAVAFAPDGKRLASGSYDGSFKLWDASTGQELFTRRGPGPKTSGGVTGVISIAFAPDGKRFVTSGSDEMVKLWDTITGQELLALKAHAGVTSVAFSPDGKRLATGSDDRTAKLWDAATGQELLTLNGHTRPVYSVAFSPDGQRLATSSGDSTAKLWNVATGQELLTLKGHAQPVTRVAFSPDGKWLATGSWDRTVKLWDAATGRELRTLTGQDAPMSKVAFSLDGRQLAAGSLNGIVQLWDVTTGQEIGKLAGPAEVRNGGMAFSPDGKRLALCNTEFIIRLFDAGTFQEVTTLKGHGGGVTSVAFSPDGKRLASSSRDGTVKLWDLVTGQELLTLKLTTVLNGVLRVAFSPDGKRLAALIGGDGRGGTLRVWSVASDGR